MSVVDIILSFPFVLLSLGVSAIVFVFKTIAEEVVEELVISHWFQKVVLPVLPVLIGALLGLLCKAYTYPEGVSGYSGRCIFGIVAGLASSSIYTIVKQTLRGLVSNTEEEK